MARTGRSRRREKDISPLAVVEKVRTSPDPQAAAQEALQQAPTAQARQAILEASAAAPDAITAAFVSAALLSGDSRLSRMGADLLGDAEKSPDALQVLKECVRSDDATVRGRAMEAVPSYSDPEGLSVLAAGLADPDASVRRAAVAALGIIVGIMQHPVRAAALERLSLPDGPLARAVVASEDEHVRRQAAQALAFVDSEAVLPVLQRLSKDEDAEVRQEAVLALTAFGTPAAVSLMAECVDDSSYRVVSTVLDALAAQLGATSSAFLSHLEKALEHPVVEARRHAVLMLERFDPGDIEDVLERSAADEDFEVARRAGEMLLRSARGRQLTWLADEMSGPAGSRAFGVWEAGNIGQDIRVGTSAGDATQENDDRSRVAPLLEQALRDGSASDRVHAVNELVALVDISDSPGMQAALYDTDSAVRSRAADGLSYTRDAGLLVRVLADYPDAQVRRSAADALAGNPGGRPSGGAMGGRVSFTSTRTVGVPLFSAFVRALHDPDQGVVRTACGAVRDCVQAVQMCPVRETVLALEPLTRGDSVSLLLQEDATEALEAVEDVPAGVLIAGAAQQVLAWRGQLAREAHALSWDGGSKSYKLAARPDDEAVARWKDDYELSDEAVAAVQRAAGGDGGLDAQVAGRIIHGLTRDLAHALECVFHASRAVALIGARDAPAALQAWQSAMGAAPDLDWGPGKTAAALQRRLRRLRMQAWVETVRAQAAMGSPLPEESAEVANDYDDWVKLTALTGLRAQDTTAQDEMLRLCRAHIGEEDDAAPVCRAALALIRAGRAEGTELLAAALPAVDVDLRIEFCQDLLMAAQDATPAGIVRAYLDERPVLEDLTALCMAMALRGAGNDLGSLTVPDVESADADPEVVCAARALRAMAGDVRAAEALEDALRTGETKERYLSAHYLTFARVRSAVPTFASVRDQDVPAMLRAACAQGLLRSGHSGGTAWFEKALEGLSGTMHALVLVHLCRAVEDTVPLMLTCKDVNIGRFV